MTRKLLIIGACLCAIAVNAQTWGQEITEPAAENCTSCSPCKSAKVTISQPKPSCGSSLASTQCTDCQSTTSTQGSCSQPSCNESNCTQSSCAKTTIKQTCTQTTCQDGKCEHQTIAQCPGSCSPGCCSHGEVSNPSPHSKCAASLSGMSGELVSQLSGQLPLPGTTPFIRQQCSEATQMRDQLAKQLTNFVIENAGNPDQIEKVLQIALDSTANFARQEAIREMDSSDCNRCDLSASSPAVFPNSRPFFSSNNNPASANSRSPMPRETTRGTPLPMLTNPLPPLNPTANRPNLEMTNQMRAMKKEYASMKNVVQLIQQDLQNIARDLTQLQVETKMGTHTGQVVQAEQWRAVRNPYTDQPKAKARTNQAANYQSMVSQLQQEVQMLRRQLANQPINQPTSQLINQPNHYRTDVQQATYYRDGMALTPMTRQASPLTPRSSRTGMVSVSYYVGDVMQPPFANATLRLMQFIKNNVASESWVDTRMMQVTDPSISLLITQTRENHEIIADLLSQIRAGKLSYYNK